MKKTTEFGLLASFLVSLAASAQTPYLIKDINVTATDVTASSAPHDFFPYGSKVLFTTTATSIAGPELWATDGTEARTEKIARIPSGISGVPPSRFTLLNGKVLFNALSVQGIELWITDGTTAGTRLLTDIFSGPPSSNPGDRIVHHSKMLFAANDGVNGNELWITDGTPEGTRLVIDINPGARGSDPASFTVFNDLIYFVARDALWKTDGTESGTVRVTDQIGLSSLLVAGTRLFFMGRRDSTYTLWVSDGTEAGTQAITQAGSPEISFSSLLTPFGSRVLFIAADKQHGTELWISDGTATGTHIVRDIVPGSSGSFVSTSEIAASGNVAIFNTIRDHNEEIWRTDGTEGGTTLVHSFGFVPAGSSTRALVFSGDKFFFAGYGGNGPTLWVTDGTAGGTHAVKSGLTLPFFSPAASAPFFIAGVNGVVYFSGANSLNGFEPWRSDGTDAGTFMIKNINSDQAPSSDPDHLTAAGDWLYFDAWDGLSSPGSGRRRSVWRTDGTPSGTLQLTDTQASDYVPFGRSIFFQRDGQWTTDGTPEGTTPEKEITGRFAGVATILFVMGDKVFVSVLTPGASQSTLWLTTTNPGAAVVPMKIGYPSNFAEVAGRAMFFGEERLWVSDGTASGTRTVAVTGTASKKGVALSGVYYFSTPLNVGSRLWKSDGTFEGTEALKTFSGDVTRLVASAKRVFFTMTGQLWTTDGTETGTVRLTQNTTTDLAAASDRAVFAMNDSVTGSELWTTDGTSEGTHLLRDIYPGAPGSHPWNFAGIDGQVYFSATDDLHGTEMWVTDGTLDRTKLAADIVPGPQSSDPQSYVRAGQHLYFTARTDAEGEELWAVLLAPDLRIDDTHAVESGDGTSRTARFTISLSAVSAQAVTASYTTSNGSALSGTDYEPVSGTVTFGPGETTRTIDVRVMGDEVSEATEVFFVTLSNPSGATIAKRTAVAIIDDDDQIADLALSLDFSNFMSRSVVAYATNKGPRAATEIHVQRTVTPAETGACTTCSDLHELRAGATASALSVRTPSQPQQEYFTATAIGAQRDPNLSDNTVAWTARESLAMDALNLTPGSVAKAWLAPPPNLSSVSIESSNTSVLEVPANIPISASDKAVSFVVRGLNVGSATIRVFTPSAASIATLRVDVVPAGTRLRWQPHFTAGGAPFQKFDVPALIVVNLTGAAPFTGESPTGQITVTAKGREIAHIAATGIAQQLVEVYLPDVGMYPLTVAYAGDSNFLPAATTHNILVTRGNSTLTAWAEKNGANVIIHVRVAGSPMSTPTGVVTIAESAVVIPQTETKLTAGPTGAAYADVELTNVSAGTHTYIVEYQGDTRYLYSYQNVRVGDGRRRAVKH